MCPGQDLNLHPRNGDLALNQARLPIPPPGQNFVGMVGLEPTPPFRGPAPKAGVSTVPPHPQLVMLTQEDSNLRYQSQNLTC